MRGNLITKPMYRLAALAFFFASASAALAQSDHDFKGKTVRIIIGTSTGGGVDLYARLVAQFLGKHWPGEPTIVPQNMPGGSSLVAANYVYNIAKPDGLTLGALQGGVFFDQILARDTVKFDWAKFTWIGSPERLEAQLYMRGDSPYKTLEDIRRATEAPRCGGAGTGATGYFVPKILEEALGLKFKTVTGYQSGGEIDLAVERGELHCRAFDIGSFVGRDPTRTWFKNGFVKSLIQTGRKRDGRLGDVPTLYELMDKQKTPDSLRRMATVILSSGGFGRPMLAPPGMTPDVARTIRDSYAKMLKDPEFIAEVKKRRYDLEPVSWEEMQSLANEVTSQPPEVVERVKKILEN
ncbi:MAG TPA: tripartite tricarboxylate transporter substrate-binding protein [Candidatus Saccharimonadales bacterium]|nr:tripartite tricarboxylate transporter substrate-binding protein [Candidatus Saccharimonadales bacterium]